MSESRLDRADSNHIYKGAGKERVEKTAIRSNNHFMCGCPLYRLQVMRQIVMLSLMLLNANTLVYNHAWSSSIVRLY